MSILDVKIIKDYIRMCNDGWEQGWHERNGGNLTYRMTEEEIDACRPYFREPEAWVDMGVCGKNLGGSYFLTTGSGKFFRNVIIKPEDSICMIELDEKGENYRIVSISYFPAGSERFTITLHSATSVFSRYLTRLHYAEPTQAMDLVSDILPIPNF